MKMNRQHVAKKRMSDNVNDDYVPGTVAERIEMVWPLTVEALSLSKRYEPGQRMQRYVTRLRRRKVKP